MNTRLNAPLLLTSACLAIVSCDNKNQSTSTKNQPGAKTSTPTNADNTANNKGDGQPGAATPGEQSQAASDIRITADIRRAVLADKTMSINAQNCKIITEHGVVTLRGVVDSASEKAAIADLAQKCASVVRVDNQLEVKAPG